ncbi:hypothetical protein FCE95_15830 [Luteimonas gilva]|uniref:Uncharacterized protein n=1 Tax=Luteimonas gilva TaxID=2572684 RepID=A0A4U5JP35_9GAMM|nr:hypothetical protein [Luteimonas gilva]TKR29597.1 hypothetical protein FCE95_15830 [Luteimonas gilva]
MKKLKAVGKWLAAARHVWIGIGVIVAALFVCLQPSTPERVIRLTGMVLQLLGIGTVIWGISTTRSLFGHPSVLQKIKTWFKSFPLFRRNAVVTATGSGTFVLSGGGRSYGTYGAGANPTIESRLDALEKNISVLHNRISQAQAESDRGLRNLSDRVDSEQHHRQAGDAMVQEKLEATSTGGVHISAIGAAWLFVGVILSTAALEIADLLS